MALKDNSVHCGDCINLLHEAYDLQVDLIYLDPPYNTQKDFGEFNDRWKDPEVVNLDLERLRRNWQPWDALNELIFDDRSLKIYLGYLIERLFYFRRVLSDRGSIYLHCDPRVSHYIKIIMDNLFGKDNFRNEIVWSYRTGGSSQYKFAPKHDVILYYTKCHREGFTFNLLKEKVYPKNTAIKAGEQFKVPELFDEYGRSYREANMRDIWDDILAVGRTAKERNGYPTQKPLKLLERIIHVSSNPGDIILDPFCGSGTTLKAAQNLGRKWIGIDINPNAVKIAEERLSNEQLRLL